MAANWDLDETSFNLDDIGDDDIDVLHEDRVEVAVEVNMDSLPPPPIDEEKKKEFERKRDEILSCVPEEVKARFGQIYFSSFGKFVGPVLIMNPYKVEPGPLRNQWITMFRNVSTSKGVCLRLSIVGKSYFGNSHQSVLVSRSFLSAKRAVGNQI